VFKLVLPGGRLLWPSVFPNGKVGTPYASHMQSSGGKAPVHWKVASGKLAPGLKLNGSTGAVTGTPTTKGAFGCEVQATDSESPPKQANLAVSITIK
jgi:large repetitive protein